MTDMFNKKSLHAHLVLFGLVFVKTVEMITYFFVFNARLSLFTHSVFIIIIFIIQSVC